MTITGIYTQNLTLSFNSSSSPLLTPVIVGQKPGADAPAAGATDPAAAATDTVTISPEAIIKQTVAVTLALAPAPADDADPTAATAAEPGPGDALFAALDADGDGTVTRDEFVEGAQDLLQRAGRHGRSHGHHRGRDVEGGDRHSGHEGSRLTRRLDRLFELVDANGDGSVEKTELAGALQRTKAARAVAQSSTPSAGPDATLVVAEPPSPEAATRVKTAPAAATTAGAEPEASAAVTTTKNKPADIVAGNDAPQPAGAFVTITQITITIAIQQYTTVGTSGSTGPSNTLNAAA